MSSPSHNAFGGDESDQNEMPLWGDDTLTKVSDALGREFDF